MQVSRQESRGHLGVLHMYVKTNIYIYEMIIYITLQGDCYKVKYNIYIYDYYVICDVFLNVNIYDIYINNYIYM